MGTQRTRPAGQQSPLRSERGNTTISDAVVSQVAGIAAQEVEAVQMGGGTARTVGGILDSVAGGSGQARGITVARVTPRITALPFFRPGVAPEAYRADILRSMSWRYR
jgi:hypothetical protein